MGSNLTRGKNQPFYNIIVNLNNSPVPYTYVAEENLNANSNKEPIVNPDIGKYFDEYDPIKQCYIPNQDIMSEYPDY